jgi:hypothetical protein
MAMYSYSKCTPNAFSQVRGSFTQLTVPVRRTVTVPVAPQSSRDLSLFQINRASSQAKTATKEGRREVSLLNNISEENTRWKSS